jgi:5'-methylthioadenosine phosphorylase
LSAPESALPLGVIGGSAFLDEVGAVPGVAEVERMEVATDEGPVTVRRIGECLFIRRHGEERYHPPHRVRHHAHILALESLGVREVVGLASVGALTTGLAPGDVVVPDDYLSRDAPPTFAGDEPLHIVPELDGRLRGVLVQAARRAGAPRIVEEGVYAETTGPRFETRAEVRSLARDAAVVGMTAASEATLAQERGMRYAVLCIVDNMAHGVGEGALTLEGFRAMQAANGALTRRILGELASGRRRQG